MGGTRIYGTKEYKKAFRSQRLRNAFSKGEYDLRKELRTAPSS